MIATGRELELRTQRLLLRSFRATDVEDALAHRDDPELAATRDVIAPRKLASLLPPLLAGQLPATPIVLHE